MMKSEVEKTEATTGENAVSPIPIHISGLVEPFPVLVACQLTQECLIGADFLSHFRCHIDMSVMHILVKRWNYQATLRSRSQ